MLIISNYCPKIARSGTCNQWNMLDGFIFFGFLLSRWWQSESSLGPCHDEYKTNWLSQYCVFQFFSIHLFSKTSNFSRSGAHDWTLSEWAVEEWASLCRGAMTTVSTLINVVTLLCTHSHTHPSPFICTELWKDLWNAGNGSEVKGQRRRSLGHHGSPQLPTQPNDLAIHCLVRLRLRG